MDIAQRTFYRLSFENAFLKKKGNEFQDFFASLMEKSHVDDFQRVRPYGKDGDMKCDGYLSSEKRVFQCYAPAEMKDSKVIHKAKTDFAGAVVHWKDMMAIWTFVHNDCRGLSPRATQCIEDLKDNQHNIRVDKWEYQRLYEKAMGLPLYHLEDLFGAAPTLSTIDHLTFEEIRPVVRAIEGISPDPLSPVNAPSLEKLEANDLSDSAADYLRIGRRKERLVEDFFRRYPDPQYPEEVAEAFRRRYQALKTEGLDPDMILLRLQAYAGGMQRGTPQREAAVLAVLSYFFERCDIFEDAQPKKVPA